MCVPTGPFFCTHAKIKSLKKIFTTLCEKLNFYFSVVLAILYASTTPRFMPDADGPEFVVIGITGRIAHPPGYPLYCIVLRFINLLFSNTESSFSAFGYVSALLSGIAAFVMLDLLTRLDISIFSRFIAVGVSFTGFAIWHVSNNIEPFALNLALCAGVLWCTAALSSSNFQFKISQIKTVGSLGLLFGLGVCNHHTQALLVPMAAYAIIRVSIEKKTFSKSCLIFVTGIVLGLLPLMYFSQLILMRPCPGAAC